MEVLPVGVAGPPWLRPKALLLALVILLNRDTTRLNYIIYY